MKSEVLKRGLFLLVFLSLVGVVSAAHTVDVSIINYTSFYETQNTNFSIIVNFTGGPYFIDKINVSIPTDNLQIISYNSINNYPCSDVIQGSNFIINCSDAHQTSSEFLLNITAKLLDISQNIPITVYTIDFNGDTVITPKLLNILNDNSPPTYNIITPQNNSFTNNASQLFSVDVSDTETGIDSGNLSYFKCGDLINYYNN